MQPGYDYQKKMVTVKHKDREIVIPKAVSTSLISIVNHMQAKKVRKQAMHSCLLFVRVIDKTRKTRNKDTLTQERRIS